jgi:hypothetical protein
VDGTDSRKRVNLKTCLSGREMVMTRMVMSGGIRKMEKEQKTKGKSRWRALCDLPVANQN